MVMWAQHLAVMRQGRRGDRGAELFGDRQGGGFVGGGASPASWPKVTDQASVSPLATLDL
jgi:hypothetical protein